MHGTKNIIRTISNVKNSRNNECPKETFAPKKSSNFAAFFEEKQ